MSRKPFPPGFRIPREAFSPPTSRIDFQDRPLDELEGQALLRALAELDLDRKIESLTSLLDVDGSYLAVIDDRRQYFLATHGPALSVVSRSLSPDRVFTNPERRFRVDAHTQRDLLDVGGTDPLPVQLGWRMSAAARIPWSTDHPVVVAGVFQDTSGAFGTADVACLRQWARDVKDYLRQKHRRGGRARHLLPFERNGQKLRFLHEILDQSRDAFFLVDPETGRFEGVSRQAGQETGLAREELLGRTIMDLWKDVDDREAWHGLVRRLRRNDSDLYHEDRMQTRGGNAIPIEASLRYVERPERDYVLIVSRNLQELYRQKKARRRDWSLLETLVTHLSVPVFVKEADELRYVLVNPAFEEQIGFTEEEILGSDDRELFPQHQAEGFRRKDREVLRKQTTLEIDREAADTPHRGTRWYRTTKFPVVDREGDPVYVLGISREIDDPVQAARNLV